MPPGYYAIVDLARAFPGDPHFTIRLPSIAGYLLALLGIYWFARRKTSALFALIAVLLAALSPFRGYALEARSYALLVGFLAIAAALWQRIDEKRLAAALLGLVLALAVSCHYFGVIALSAFGAAELTFSLLTRRIRWRAWTAYFFAALPFFASLPLLVNFGRIFAKNFWSRPHWSTTLGTYQYLALAPQLTFILLLLIAFAAGEALLRDFRHGTTAPASGFSAPELVLIAGFVFYPALLVILTKIMGSGYTPRYGWPAIFGLVLGALYLLRATWVNSRPLLGAFVLAFVLQAGYYVGTRSDLSSHGARARWARLAALCRAKPTLPLVIASSFTYLQATEYAPPELRKRLVDVVDPKLAVRFTGTDSVDKTNRILAQFNPLQVKDRALFEADNKQFFVYSEGLYEGKGIYQNEGLYDGGGLYDWFTPYLLTSHYHLILLSTDGDNSLYIAEP